MGLPTVAVEMAAILRWARAVWTASVSRDHPLAIRLPESSGHQVLHIVSLYKHVGTMFDSDCSLMAESALRTSSANAALNGA